MVVPQFFGLRGSRLQLAVGILAGLDFLLFGYDQGVFGGLLTLESFISIFPTVATNGVHWDSLSAPEKSIQSTRQGITVACYNLGCFSGAVMIIWLGDILGRRKTIFTGSSIMVIGALLQCTSYSLPQLIIGRLVTGFGNGMNTSTVPTWQSECSPSHHRGKMVMIEGALITCGIMIAYWVDFGLLFTDPSSVSWRFPLAFQIFFCLLIISGVLYLPESPRWLVLKGREAEAREVLTLLAEKEVHPRALDTQFREIKEAVLESDKGSFRDLFTMDENRHFHRSMLAYVNQMFQQITGINIITYYIPTLLQNQLGLGAVDSRLIAACNGTEYFLASFISVFIIEKIGRRKLMLFGAASQSLSMVALAICDGIGTTQSVIGVVVFLFVFNTVFAVGWLGMTWLYPAEIVPLRIRAPANGFSTSANWIFNFLIVMTTPVAFNNIGYKTYVTYAVINACIFPAVYFCYPETAYRSLEEMDRIFRKTTSIFNVVKIAKDEPHEYGKHGELLAVSSDEEQNIHVCPENSSGEEKNNGVVHSSPKAGVKE